MKRICYYPWVIATFAVALMQLVTIITVPLADAVEIGGDENVEFNKALLYVEKPDAISKMWNDQPFGYTWIIANVMEAWGDHYLWIVRLLSSLLTVAAVCGMVYLGGIRSWIGGVACAVMFMTWIDIPALSVSAMTELNAIVLATLGAVVTVRFAGQIGNWAGVSGVILGGAMFGAALNVKLTAALIGPATVAAMIVRFRGIGTPSEREGCEIWQRRGGGRGMLRAVVLFGIATIVSGAVIYLVLPSPPLGQLVGTHLGTMTAEVASRQSHDFGSILPRMTGFCLSIVAVSVALVRGNVRDLVWPVTLCITVTSVHVIYETWWHYYEIHFAIPLSMLGGIGVERISRKLREEFQFREAEPGRRKGPFGLDGLGLHGASLGVAMFLTWQMPQYLGELGGIHDVERISDLPVLGEVRKLKGEGEWLFVSSGAVAHLSGVPIPPSLTVLARKREWIGASDEQYMLSEIKRYRPAQLVFDAKDPFLGKRWEEFVTDEYRTAGIYGGMQHFVRKGIGREGREKVDKEFRERLRALGLLHEGSWHDRW